MIAETHKANPNRGLASRRWIAAVLCFALVMAGVLHAGDANASSHEHASTALAAGIDGGAVPCEEGVDHGFGHACSTTAACAFCIPVPQGLAFFTPAATGLHAAATIQRRGIAGAPRIRPPKRSLQV